MYYPSEREYGYDENDVEQFPPYLVPQEVMELLRIGKNTCYDLLASGKLKGFRIGKQWRVARDALEAYAKGMTDDK